MSDLRRISFIACFLIVVLRISIGWQLLYEGLWKLDSQAKAKPWTAEGYLKNAQGPLRDHFRNLTGDPDDMNWLDPATVAARWDDWQQRFVTHYGLDENQQKRLNDLLNGPEDFRAVLKTLPPGVKIGGSLGKAIQFDAKRQRLIVPGNWHMLPAERDRMLKMVNVKANPTAEEKAANDLAKTYQKAVRDVYARSARLSFKERLGASLIGDPTRAGLVLEEHAGTIDYKRPGEIELYQIALAEYEADLAVATQDFEYEHLGFQLNKLREMRSKLVGPIKALDADLKEQARDLLTEEQLLRGPVVTAPTQMDRIDQQTMWGLIILGVLLIAGLFSRLSALAAAGMIMMFYLAMPPWPGVPEAPGPEHSFIVNKNFIEAIALLGLATMPTGRWFGMDALIRRFILRKKTD